jgi:hypothetical protein
MTNGRTGTAQLSKTAGQVLPVKRSKGGSARVRRTSAIQLTAVTVLSLLISSLGNHAVAHWLGLSHDAPWTRSNAVYRRVGPRTGQQVFCGGSSLLVAGLDWPSVSRSIGRGIENWTVAGSSPEVWEVFQELNRVSDTTIIGVSVYDLNEMRLTPERASFVPFATTVRDLWASGADPDLRQRMLAQYAISYIRLLYPLAGDADKVLVGLRSKGAALLGQEANLQQHEAVVVEKEGTLEVEDATDVSQWSSARVLRRLETLRAENHGTHQFSNGPKTRAFRRVLSRAQQQGRVIVVVLPVSQYYVDAFLDKATVSRFEKSLKEGMAAVPGASLVRLDQVPGISDNKNFLDLVHLNSSGRRVLTPVFLKKISENTFDRTSQMPFADSMPNQKHPVKAQVREISSGWLMAAGKVMDE